MRKHGILRLFLMADVFTDVFRGKTTSDSFLGSIWERANNGAPVHF